MIEETESIFVFFFIPPFSAFIYFLTGKKNLRILVVDLLFFPYAELFEFVETDAYLIVNI